MTTPGTGPTGSRFAATGAKRAGKKKLAWMFAPVLGGGALVAVGALVFITLISGVAGAPSGQTEVNTIKQAQAAGVSRDDLSTLRSVAAARKIPWELLLSLAMSESTSTSTPIAVATPPAGAVSSTIATSGSSSVVSTTAAPSVALPVGSGFGLGPFALTEDSDLDEEEAVNVSLSADYVAGLLREELSGQPGYTGIQSLVYGAGTGKGSNYTVDVESTDYQDRRKSFIAALITLPVANANEAFMGQVYDAAQAWALGQTAAACGSAMFSGIVGGGLSADVPEPMRSEIIAGAQAAGVSPGAIAALYLTEQNGFQFTYRFYDSDKNMSAFQLSPTAAEWHLDRYGTTGIWPAGGKFRGPYQFGPVWESTYGTPAHPNVLKFADAAFGAAQYMADLGMKTDAESIRKAAEGYNGQKSFDIGGGIRNPDPAKYHLVRELYADQVVQLAAALADGGDAPPASGSSGAPTSGPSATTPAPSTTPVSSAPSTGVSSSGSVLPSAAAPNGGVSSSCASSAGNGGAGTVIANGVNVTIPAHADVAPELQGKIIVAPNAQVAAGIAWGLSQLGTPYVFGGGGLGSANPGGPDNGCNRSSCLPLVGYDCSGLAWSVFFHMNPGMQLSVGNSGGMAAGGVHVPIPQAVAGDLLTYGGANTHHVGVALGYIDGKLAILEAPQTGLNVRLKFSRTSDLNGWASRYWGPTGGTK
ncbi:MAG: NlpC/P60 family protein [Nakamurella sp.]